MKKFSVLVAAILICSGTLAYAQQTPSEFMASWVAEYNNNDPATIVSYYDRSEDTDCLVSVGIWLKGFDEIEQMYHQDMGAIHFYDSRAEGMRHRILGETAVVSFIHRFKYRFRDTGDRYRIHESAGEDGPPKAHRREGSSSSDI